MLFTIFFLTLFSFANIKDACKDKFRERHLKFDREELDGPDTDLKYNPAFMLSKDDKIEAILHENLLARNGKSLEEIAKDHRVTYNRVERISRNLVRKLGSSQESVGQTTQDR